MSTQSNLRETGIPSSPATTQRPATDSPTTTAPSTPEAETAPLLVYQSGGGFTGSGRTLLVWPDGEWRQYGSWVVNIADIDQIVALASVVPAQSGTVDPKTAGLLVDALASDVSQLRMVADDTTCLRVDGVAHGYAFPTAQPPISFTVCRRPALPAVYAADDILAEIAERLAQEPWEVPPQSPRILQTVMRNGPGRLIEGTVHAVDGETALLQFEVTRTLAGPSGPPLAGSFTVEFEDRGPTEAELAALAGLQPGDPVWAVIDSDGAVVSTGVFAPHGDLVDVGPGRGGLSLGNHAAVFAALDLAGDPQIVCRLDPEYRDPLTLGRQRADALAAALQDLSVAAQRQHWRFKPRPRWTKFVDIAITEPTDGRWLALSAGNGSIVFGLGDVLEVGQLEPGDTVEFSFDRFPSSGPLRVWELDRQVLESAQCGHQDVTWLPTFLEEHGTLLVTVGKGDIGAPGLRIDLATLTYETGRVSGLR